MDKDKLLKSLPITNILEKDRSYRISFKNDTERKYAVERLKSKGFDVNFDFDNERQYLFLSTYDNLRLGGWDSKNIYYEKINKNTIMKFQQLVDLCNE